MQRFDLKRFRIDRELTQKELAELLMCKQNYISNIENGIKPISKRNWIYCSLNSVIFQNIIRIYHRNKIRY